MITAPIPDHESSRIESLQLLDILDTPFEDRFDRVTRLAAELFSVPIALVSIIDDHRQWFKSCYGLSTRETSRDISFCGHVVCNGNAMVVADAVNDKRFADNPLVTGSEQIRFYAGHPVAAPDGNIIGTLCIIDRKPRELAPERLELLADLAKIVEREIGLKNILILQKELTCVNSELSVQIKEKQKLEAKREELVNELECTNKDLEDFAYTISHDLKAPLRGINSLASWLYTDYADKIDADGQEHLSLIINRAQRMEKLISGVLQYSRIGRVKESVANVNLAVEVPQIVDLINSDGSVKVVIGDNLPTVRGEPTRIIQVFQNLIGNAIKFMDKPDGCVTINSRDVDDTWEFTITDNGPGIASRYHDKIFQIFQTLAARDEFESTGVGLALVKKTVEIHGGKVWLESEIGAGSKFHFSIPKTSRKAPPEGN